MSADEAVLELGAGTGVVSRALLEGGVPPEQLIVVEIVPDMADHLRGVLPGVLVIEGDARNLPDLLPRRLARPDRQRGVRHSAGAAAAGGAAAFHRGDRGGGSRPRLPPLQLLRHLAAALAQACAGGAARGLDATQLSRRRACGATPGVGGSCPPSADRMETMLVRIAPFAFVLLWSSSFIASRVGLRYLSPLLFVTVRMVFAAAVLVAVMLRCGGRGAC